MWKEPSLWRCFVESVQYVLVGIDPFTLLQVAVFTHSLWTYIPKLYGPQVKNILELSVLFYVISSFFMKNSSLLSAEVNKLCLL